MNPPLSRSISTGRWTSPDGGGSGALLTRCVGVDQKLGKVEVTVSVNFSPVPNPNRSQYLANVSTDQQSIGSYPVNRLSPRTANPTGMVLYGDKFYLKIDKQQHAGDLEISDQNPVSIDVQCPQIGF